MKVLVCGGRDIDDVDFVWGQLSIIAKERNITCVIDGAAKGVDSLASKWALQQEIPSMRFPAAWDAAKIAGRPGSAGPIRNQWVLALGKPQLVVAFPGNEGTANMVMQAKKAGIEVIEVIDES